MSIKNYQDGEDLPLINYAKCKPRRSKLVAAYRWFQVVVALALIGGLFYRGVL